MRSIVRLAYIAYLDEYFKVEELPSGKGIADMVFIPMSGSRRLPMVVDLKWNRSPDSAISQILRKEYNSVLGNAKMDILFVGISYDPDDGKHAAKISRLHRDGEEYRIIKESQISES